MVVALPADVGTGEGVFSFPEEPVDLELLPSDVAMTSRAINEEFVTEFCRVRTDVELALAATCAIGIFCCLRLASGIFVT